MNKDELILHVLQKVIPGDHNPVLDLPHNEDALRNMITVGFGFDKDAPYNMVNPRCGWNSNYINIGWGASQKIPNLKIEHGIYGHTLMGIPRIAVPKTPQTQALAIVSNLGKEQWLAMKKLLCADEIDWDTIIVTASLLVIHGKKK